MGLQTSIENVTRTEDGPYECYDAVVTAHDISQLYKTGFLKVDDARQRGIDSVTGKRIIDDEKVEKWAEQLVTGEAYLGQLSWNFRKDETSLEYDETKRSLKSAPERRRSRIPDTATWPSSRRPRAPPGEVNSNSNAR